MPMENTRIAMRASWNTIIANVVLSAFKLFAGVFAHSAAMVSDAVHSLSDILSTVVVMVGVKMAGKQSDQDHPYGHERMESVAAMVLAAVLAATGLLIGWDGIQKVIAGSYETLSAPGGLALAAAVISIAVKEAMYWYTRAAAKKTGSGALMADAWHHRSDALSSVGSFAGILGARLGFPILDPVACLLICLFILKAAADVFRDAAGKMTDRACDGAFVESVRAVILENRAVVEADSILTRLFGDKIYIDAEISIDGKVSLYEAHAAAHEVHDEIERRFPKVKHCMIHVNPAAPSDGGAAGNE